MDKIIVYVDDAAYAQQQLAPMRGDSGASSATHWVLVACAPRLARHIGKWVNRAAKASWRARWADELFAELKPALQRNGDEATLVVADQPLVDLTKSLRARHGGARVLDARRPKVGHPLPAITPEQQVATDDRWTVPGAVAGMGAVLVLAAE